MKRENLAAELDDPVLRQCLQILVDLARPNRIWLFGSRARGDHDSRSDFDLALEGASLPEGERWRIENELESLPTLRRIDLVWWESAGAELRKQIARDGVAVYERRV